MRRPLLCCKIRRDPKSNPASVPQKDDGCGGATAPQGLPFSQGLQTLLQFCSVLVQCPWYLLFATNGGHYKGRKQNRGAWEKWELGPWWHQTQGRAWLSWVSRLPNWWLPWSRPGRAVIPPVSKVVPGNMAMDGGTVVGAPPVTQTPTVAGVALPDNPSLQPTHGMGGRGYRELGWWSGQPQAQCKGEGVAGCQDSHSPVYYMSGVRPHG